MDVSGVLGKPPRPRSDVWDARGEAVLFLVGFVAFLKDLRIDVLGSGPATLGNIAGDVHELALFLTGWARLGGGRQIHGVSAFIAFPNRHLHNSFLDGLLWGLSSPVGNNTCQ
jgi:hypothetical protein